MSQGSVGFGGWFLRQNKNYIGDKQKRRFRETAVNKNKIKASKYIKLIHSNS